MEEIPKQKPEKHIRVRVSGWSCSRDVIVRSNEVAMEIARTHCSHCPTCRGRATHCEQALEAKQFTRQSAGGGEYFILPFVAGLAKSVEEITTFLGRQLKLQIRPVED